MVIGNQREERLVGRRERSTHLVGEREVPTGGKGGRLSGPIDIVLSKKEAQMGKVINNIAFRY